LECYLRNAAFQFYSESAIRNPKKPETNFENEITNMKNHSIKSSLFVLTFMFCALFSRESLAATQPWGTALGSFNGVENYSNGNGTYNSGVYNYIGGNYIGLEWQCVEYVRRYYYTYYGMDLYSLGGGMDAWQFFGNAANMNLTAYANGGTTAPQIGDILCFNQTGSGLGHVAIIRAIGSSTVTVIQQNVKNGDTGPNGADDNYTFAYNPSTQVVDVLSAGSSHLGTTFFCQGWLRKTNSGRLPAPTLSTPVNSATGVSTTPSFSWSQVSGNQGYRIVVSTLLSDLPTDPTQAGGTPGNGFNQTVSQNTTSYTWFGTLTAGATYYWEVHALGTSLNQAGYWSAENNFTTIQSTVPITFATSPAGLQVTVDSTTYTAPTTFNWTPGSQHSLSVPTPQYSGLYSRYVFNGTQNQTITTPSSSYTFAANLSTQYDLTMAAGTGGSVSPIGGWYDSGSVVAIGATPTSGYSFSSWAGSGTGSYSGTINSTSVTMNAPIFETATFTANPQTGSLKVTIGPASAISAGAQWQVDGGAWQNSGATVASLSVGNGHTLAFKAVTGWTTPGTQTPTITANQTTTATGTYVAIPQTGSLQVSISPTGAISAGAQWQVDGGAWQNSGATVSGLAVGSGHTLAFKAVSGWTTPGSQTPTITANQTTTATGTYAAIPQTGSLQVTISPAGAVSAGAQWQVDNGAWENSGITLSDLTIGNHTVVFKVVSGWTTPINQTPDVSANQTTTANGTYVAMMNNSNIVYVWCKDGTIQKFDTNGVNSLFATNDLSGGFGPVGLTLNNLGDLYAGVPSESHIWKFSPDGTRSLIGSLDSVSGLAFDNTGNLYATFPNWTEIDKLNYNPSQGRYGVTTLLYTQSHLSYPINLVFDSAGNFYVANNTNAEPSYVFLPPSPYDNTIEKFSTNFTDLGTFATGLNCPSGMAFDSGGNLYVANSGTNGSLKNTIMKFTSGGVISTFATASSGLNAPQGLAFDSAGNLYVANSGNGNILMFTPDGNSSVFASGLTSPTSIAIFPGQNVWSATPPPPPTKIITLGGNLSFGNVTVGDTVQATLTITNTGNTALTVTSISYPTGFTGAWSGAIAANNSQQVTVTFAPTTVQSFNDELTVNSDKTSGVNTMAVSGAGTPRALTVSDITAVNRPYDGTTVAALNTVGATLIGVLAGDTVTLVTSGTVGAFANKNVGDSKSVAVSGLTLSGSAAANYTLTLPTLTANITPLGLTVTGITATNKVYDGTTSATITGVPVPSGVLGSDAVSFSGTASGSFASKAVGNNILVTVSGLTLNGTDAANYTLTLPTLTANITPLGLTVTGITATNKVYDGTAAATLDTSSAALVGVLSMDTGNVALVTSGATGVFANKNVGTNKLVTISGLTLSGTAAGNYTVIEPTTTANIVVNPVFNISSSILVGHQFNVTVSTVPGANYTLEFKNSLSDSNWTVAESLPGTGGAITLTDSSTTNHSRFYRVLVQ
jgi:hypothetical protein